MTRDEFLVTAKKYGATFAPAVSMGNIILTNTALQQIRAAMLPQAIIDLYTVTGGIILGSGYIFGPAEFSNNAIFPVPSIAKVNDELSGIAALRGHTIFGRNDLFLFTFDTFGNFYMHDNVTLRPLRKYADAYRAILDCLIAGKL